MQASTHQRGTRLSSLAMLTIGSLVSSIATSGIWFIMISQVVVPIAIGMALMLVVALLVAMRVRWALIVGAIIGGGNVLWEISNPYIRYRLLHPADFGFFAVNIVIIACGLVSLLAGSAAFAGRNLPAKQAVPAFMRTALAVLSGLVLGALLVAGLAAGNQRDVSGQQSVNARYSISSSGGSGAGTIQVATVHVNLDQFLPTAITVAKGGKVEIVDDGSFIHILANGTWSSGVAHPQVESGAPLVKDRQINGGSINIGPFTMAGVYHIYCSIHPGMQLTITVQ